MDYPLAKFGDFSFSRFDVIVNHTKNHGCGRSQSLHSRDLSSA